MNIYDKGGGLIAPYTINWFLDQKDFPYEIVQKSGDDNALGIIKFNFLNPFSVYLHDTNQRSLFDKSRRSLSHGCIRLQDWMGLLLFIVKYNNLHLQVSDRKFINLDTITEWLAHKENHRINLFQKLSIFVGYYGCEGVAGNIQIYEDIYKKDKMMLEKYFITK
jgi:murein L,D-transpeptidase YcbB/YkuD